MEFPVINTRADLDALAGTPAHDAFMMMLAGSLWRLEKDDGLQTWVANEDNSTIDRFGFTRTDFPYAVPPGLPPYEPPAPAIYTCSPWQIRKALNNQNLRQAVEDAVAASEDYALKDGWEYATEFRSDDPFVINMGSALGLDQAGVDNLIQYASTL